MGVGFAAMAADRQGVFGDLAAEFLEREVIEVIAERVFDLNTDLLDPEEGVRNTQNGRNGQPAERSPQRPYSPSRVFARSAAGSAAASNREFW
jgi:hypothetical protein